MDVDVDRATKGIGARSLLVEFLGAFVRRTGGWFPIAPAVALLGEVGMDESSVRMAVSRLKSRGWLEPERRAAGSGYSLASAALAALAEGDEFIYRERGPADLADGWVLVAFSIPEPQRSKRHALKARLAAAGFGHAGPGLLLAPARMLPEARRITIDLEVADFVQLFTAHYEGADIGALVRSGWDLPELEQRYRALLELARPLSERWSQPAADAGRAAFEDYLVLLHEWRLVTYSDPGLPASLLGPDWPAPEAHALVDRLVATLDPLALAHVCSRWPQP